MARYNFTSFNYDANKRTGKKYDELLISWQGMTTQSFRREHVSDGEKIARVNRGQYRSTPLLSPLDDSPETFCVCYIPLRVYPPRIPRFLPGRV